MGLQESVPCFWLTSSAVLPHGLHVGGVLGDVGAGGLELGEEGDLALHLRVALQHPAVGLKAADDVLGEVRPVHAQEEFAGKVLDEFLLLEHGLALGELLELGGVYGDRVGPHPHLAAVVVDHTVLHVGLGAENRGGRLGEVAGVAVGVEGDDVGLQQALEHALPHVGGQDAPEVGLGPGDVDEEREERARPETLPDEERGHVELVVVEEDRRRPHRLRPSSATASAKFG